MLNDTENNLDLANDLKKINSILRRWAWLLILAIALGAASSYLYSRQQTPVYEATTSILVTRSSQLTIADLTQTLSLSQMVDTYVRMMSAEDFLDIVSQRVGYHVETDDVDIVALPNTQMIQLQVQDVDPSRAALTADTMIKILAEQNKTMQAARYTEVEQSLVLQIKDTEKQVADLQTKLDAAKTTALNEQIAQAKVNIDTLVSAILVTRVELDQLEKNNSDQNQLASKFQKEALLETQQSQLAAYQSVYAALLSTDEPRSTTEIDSLKQNLTLYQNTLLSMLNSLEDIKKQKIQSTPPIEQIRPALASNKPVRPRTMLNTLLGAAAGLTIAILLVSLREMTNDTIRDAKEVGLLLDTKVIGHIPNIKHDRTGDGIYVRRDPYSAVTDAFHALRTNLEYTTRDKPVKTILVTSGGLAEGKTLIATNLAAILSQPGKTVILVDANLRRPCVHQYTGVSNASGLSNLIRTGRIANIDHPVQKRESLPNLSILPAGDLPPNPTDLLGSEKMRVLLLTLSAKYDYVVIDSSACLTVETQVLLGLVDGVVLVIVPGKTRGEDLNDVYEQVKLTGVRLLGVVVNRTRTLTGQGQLKSSPIQDFFNRAAFKIHDGTSDMPDDAEDVLDPREIVPLG